VLLVRSFFSSSFVCFSASPSLRSHFFFCPILSPSLATSSTQTICWFTALVSTPKTHWLIMDNIVCSSSSPWIYVSVPFLTSGGLLCGGCQPLCAFVSSRPSMVLHLPPVPFLEFAICLVVTVLAFDGAFVSVHCLLSHLCNFPKVFPSSCDAEASSVLTRRCLFCLLPDWWRDVLSPVGSWFFLLWSLCQLGSFAFSDKPNTHTLGVSVPPARSDSPGPLNALPLWGYRCLVIYPFGFQRPQVRGRGMKTQALLFF